MLRLGHSLGRGASLQCRRLPANQFSACWFSSDSDKEDDKATKNNDESVTAEWIPPSRPLHGDQDLSQLIRSQKELDRAEEYLFKVDENDTEEETLRRLEEALALEERLEKEGEKELLANERYQQEPVDWLQTRRQALSANDKDEPQVPVIHHQRLTESEITSLLESFGGNDITILKDDKEYPRMGGATAMIICTASNVFYVNSITKNLVEHLKERQLQDLGVLGAQMGKTFSQPTSRNNWNVVDCQNYIVHVFDQPTREVLNLEQLWSGKDPLWKLDLSSDEAVEEYVKEHHVPWSYGPNPEDNYRDTSISKLQRGQWLVPHKPVIPTGEKLKDRRAERKRRREKKQQQARQVY